MSVDTGSRMSSTLASPATLNGSEQSRLGHDISVTMRLPETPLQACDRYFDLVWANLCRLGVPMSLVEDAVQDTFLVVHRRWTEFEHRSTARTWIIGILLRVARKYRRRRDRPQTSSTPEHDTRMVTGCPEETAAEYQSLEILWRLLEGLHDTHRELLVLVELEELSVPDAAIALGIQTSTAYRRLNQAHHVFEQAYLEHRAGEEKTRLVPRSPLSHLELFEQGRSLYQAPLGAKNRLRQQLAHRLLGLVVAGATAAPKPSSMVAWTVTLGKAIVIALALACAAGLGYYTWPH